MFPKQRLYRILGIIISAIIVGYFFLFVIFPLLIIGPPCPLYFISNHDTENHTIAITVLDSTNKTVLFQSYNLQPDMTMQYARGFGWYPTITLEPFTWSEGKYTFIAILDGNITASHTTNVQYTQTIWITIEFMGKPLEIGEVYV